MIKRKGFKRFSQKIRGVVAEEEKFTPKEYALPSDMTNPHLLREIDIDSPDWVNELFIWSSSEQGDYFWDQIYHGGGDRELALEILQSWQRQLGYG